MKNKKIVTIFTVGIVSMLLLAGCGGTEDTTDIGTPTTTDPASAPTAEPTTPASDTPATVEDPMNAASDPKSVELFCGVSEANGKVTTKDVDLANEIAEELEASSDAFVVETAHNYRVFAEYFQYALDNTDSQLPSNELEMMDTSCELSVQ